MPSQITFHSQVTTCQINQAQPVLIYHKIHYSVRRNREGCKKYQILGGHLPGLSIQPCFKLWLSFPFPQLTVGHYGSRRLFHCVSLSAALPSYYLGVQTAQRCKTSTKKKFSKNHYPRGLRSFFIVVLCQDFTNVTPLGLRVEPRTGASLKLCFN